LISQQPQQTLHSQILLQPKIAVILVTTNMRPVLFLCFQNQLF
jgi:hypothetical protein